MARSRASSPTVRLLISSPKLKPPGPVCLEWSAKPTLQIATLGKGLIQLFCSHAPKIGCSACRRWQGVGEGIFPLPLSCLGIPQRGQEQLFCSLTHQPSSPAPPPTGSPLVCCLGKLPYLPSHVLQLVVARASSPTLIVPGPALLPATAARGKGKEDIFFSLLTSPHGRHKRERSVFLLLPAPLFRMVQLRRARAIPPYCCSQWGVGPNLCSPILTAFGDNRSQRHLHRLTVVQGLRFRHGLR